MREITEHRSNAVNESITVTADDQNPENGNASHEYDVQWGSGPSSGFCVKFQDGPVGVVGVNGATQEVLTAILIDRLTCFQESQWACEENAEALAHYEAALAALKRRTQKRVDRGVEGTHEV